MTTEELIKKFENTVTQQLRTFGVILYDDAGNLIKPGSGEEARIVRNIARNCAQIVVLDRDCQTPGVRPCGCPESNGGHLPSCAEYPAYLKDA